MSDNKGEREAVTADGLCACGCALDAYPEAHSDGCPRSETATWDPATRTDTSVEDDLRAALDRTKKARAEAIEGERRGHEVMGVHLGAPATPRPWCRHCSEPHAESMECHGEVPAAPSVEQGATRCPFCGVPPSGPLRSRGSVTLFEVYCANEACPCESVSVTASTADKAVRRWNAQPTLDAMRAERDAAIARAEKAEREYEKMQAYAERIDDRVTAQDTVTRELVIFQLLGEDTIQVAADAARNVRKGWHPDVMRRALAAVARYLETHPVPK